MLRECDCIVPTRCTFGSNGYQISTAHQYRLLHVSTDLIQMRFIIAKYSPNYLQSFDAVMARNWIYPCNMIICSKQLLDRYASWLFPILFRLEKRIDPLRDRDTYQQRVFGFLAERLLNVFIEQHSLRVKELDIFNPAEPEISNPALCCTDFTRPPTVDKASLSELSTSLEDIDYAPVFDYRFYFSHYPDIALAYRDNPRESLRHFLLFGAREQRVAHPNFSIKSYMNGNPRLRNQLGTSDALAYINHYLCNTDDRRHAIGYENLFKADEVENPCSIPQALHEVRLRRSLARAEQYGVLD